MPMSGLSMPPLLKTLPSSAQHKEILVPATRGLKTLETLDCLLPNNHALPCAPSLTHATTENGAVTASGYVSPNDPSLRKGYVVIKVSTYALLHVSIVQDLSERRDQHGVQV